MPGVLHQTWVYQNALLFGLFFGLIILPCNPAPIILLFALSANAADFFENIVILVAFFVGIAIPLLMISLSRLPQTTAWCEHSRRTGKRLTLFAGHSCCPLLCTTFSGCSTFRNLWVMDILIFLPVNFEYANIFLSLFSYEMYGTSVD